MCKLYTPMKACGRNVCISLAQNTRFQELYIVDLTLSIIIRRHGCC